MRTDKIKLLKEAVKVLEKKKTQKDELVAEIKRLKKIGFPLRQIGYKLGMSHEYIRQILKRNPLSNPKQKAKLLAKQLSKV